VSLTLRKVRPGLYHLAGAKPIRLMRIEAKPPKESGGPTLVYWELRTQPPESSLQQRQLDWVEETSLLDANAPTLNELFAFVKRANTERELPRENDEFLEIELTRDEESGRYLSEDGRLSVVRANESGSQRWHLHCELCQKHVGRKFEVAGTLREARKKAAHHYGTERHKAMRKRERQYEAAQAKIKAVADAAQREADAAQREAARVDAYEQTRADSVRTYDWHRRLITTTLPWYARPVARWRAYREHSREMLRLYQEHHAQTP
jgi:hypothetical protein